MKNISAGELAAVSGAAMELRRELHRYPEIAYEEHETARRVLEFLRQTPGLEIRTGVAGTGIVATLRADLSGPCVALRADMDALPMEEQSGREWSSRISGRHHACGHDGHMAMLAAAARLLGTRADELSGPVKFIFQPAEEGGAGGLKMCEEGALLAPQVDAIYGLHNNLPSPTLKLGRIAYTPGASMAGTGTFDITVIGKGGHAAFPHLCVDPITVGAAIVGQLQHLIARELDPVAAGVVTVTRFHAGTAMNIIADRARIAGTFRALDPQILLYLRDRIRAIVEGVASTHRAQVEMRCNIGYPVLNNDDRAMRTFIELVEKAGDGDRLMEVPPIMGGEDFAFYGHHVPAFFYFLPACPEGQEVVPVCHSPYFDFNDDLLDLGIRLHALVGLNFARMWNA